MSDRRLKVVFDIDGVFHDLSASICRRLEIDYSKVTNYNVWSCDKLTKEERNAIFREFSNVKAFEDSWMVVKDSEISALRLLSKVADVHINSLSFNDAIADFKDRMLSKYLNFIPKENIVLSVVGEDDKKIIEPCDVIVEDCYDNIKTAQKVSKEAGICTSGIMVMHPYNEKYTVIRCASERIVMADSLEAAAELALLHCDKLKKYGT